MLRIRLFRVGKKNQPLYKIVVTDKRRPPRAGRFIEQVGFCNPITKEKKIESERIKYWLSVGAKPSDTVYNLLISKKIIEGEETLSLLPASLAMLAREGKKIDVHKKPKKKKEAKKKATKEKSAPEKLTEKKTEEKLASVSAKAMVGEEDKSSSSALADARVSEETLSLLDASLPSEARVGDEEKLVEEELTEVTQKEDFDKEEKTKKITAGG